MDVNNYVLNKNFLAKTHNNNMYNLTIIDYYSRLYKDLCFNNSFKKTKNNIEYLKYINKIDRIKKCNSYWNVDVYESNLIKDFISTPLCHDKFCNNCKKVKQACRMSRYMPYIEPYKDNLYHITLTIPNVVGEELRNSIKRMIISFRKLISYINSNKKIRGINFDKYLYKGALRSLEITFKDNLYHPHFHCAFVFENLDNIKYIKNTYSYDYLESREERYFSDFEILIQKIWYLCYNNIEVNKKNIDNLDLGYSCIVDKFTNDDYMELFKYMTKETNEQNEVLTYSNFKTLYFATYKIKQIQGYGCFYRITDEDLESEIDKIYADIKDILCKQEKPINKFYTPLFLLNDNNFKVISRKSIYKYIKENQN